MTLPAYANREAVLTALEAAPSALLNQRIDELLDSASRDIETEVCHRRFYPEQRTQTFDWPQYGRVQFQFPWKLYLDEHSLAAQPDSVTVENGAITIPSSDVFARPDDGPPFRRLEIDVNADDLFAQGETWQRAIAVTGLFGYQIDERTVADLSGGINNLATTITVDDSSQIGVGDLLRIEDERLVVTERGLADTSQDLAVALDVLESDNGVQVPDGTAYSLGEVLTIGTEQMRILDIASNTLIVDRAYRGSVLQAHTIGADIFASRMFTVERGVLGTASAGHVDGTDILRFRFPALVRQLTVAQAEDSLLQEHAGYARVSGSGENARETRAVALRDLRERVYWAHGRTNRLLAV